MAIRKFIKILFYTFPEGHIVSDKEFERLKKGFEKSGMELIRWHKDKGEYPEPYDIVMVKGISHVLDDVEGLGKPVVYYSIGAEWKKDAPPEMNEMFGDLYYNSDYVVHIAKACQESHEWIFGLSDAPQTVIIPACEPNLPEIYNVLGQRPLKLATTCIPRPVKRVEQTEELCKKYNIELLTAYGTVDDFSYYHDCDGYIHLSRKEGMPNTVLEAMSYGLPCIVTNYGGAKEAVGDSGVILNNDPEDIPWDIDNIEPIDEPLFQEAINKFVNNLPYLRARVRERVLTKLNDRVCAEKFKEVFKRCLE